MSAGGGDFSGSKPRIFDLAGKKYAYIFSYDSISDAQTLSNAEDTELMCSALIDLGFQIEIDDNELDEKDDVISGEENDASSCDEEDHATEEKRAKKSEPTPVYNRLVIRNQKPKELVEFMENIAKTKADASCILLYFIAQQEDYDLKTKDGKTLPLFHLWKQFQGIKCPKLFILQANVTKNARIYSVLFNSEDGDEDSKYFTLPKSANMLLAYLPNSSNGGPSVAKILNEELCKPFDINTIMTTVIRRLKSMDSSLCPKFSSTLIEQLNLQEGRVDEPRGKELPVYSYGRRCLVYAFLFGQFSDPNLCDLRFIIDNDSKQLVDAFREPVFKLEFCVPNGYMTVKAFNEKLRQIVQDKEKMDSCDSIMIIMSSHGDEHCILYTYDGCISADDVWQTLSNCKELEGKPKVLAIDACRGDCHELPEKHKLNSFSKDSNQFSPKPEDMDWDKDYCEMSDVLVAMASTEGMKSYVINTCSTFIYNLCKMLKNHGRENFLTVLNLTMYNVAHSYIEDVDESCEIIPVKQQVTFTSTLQKLLYLHEKKEGQSQK